jgi:hypothetical protein
LINEDGNGAVEKIDEILEDKELDFEDFVEALTGVRYNWGYDDEYTICSDCGNIIRTSPDSYSWTPNYYVGDGYIVCKDCVKNYTNTIVNDLTNNYKKAKLY